MKPSEILLLGLKQTVTAFCRTDGSVLWKTKLEGGNGSAFITLASDERYVYATCQGVLHCLELQSGSIVWTNPLKGYGYGIASLCLPGMQAPLQAAAAARFASDAAAASAATAAPVAT
ncbi:MAG: hypothetical protein QOE70_3846 [Chthoniobacter sp.]|jgi:outer membrane protein assembly factor BamB|nr:hypothetical protein [Chthoniobacter sp.]